MSQEIISARLLFEKGVAMETLLPLFFYIH